MPNLDAQLLIDACPQCRISHPNLKSVHNLETADHAGQRKRYWRIYQCGACGGLVIAWAAGGFGQGVQEIFPKHSEVDANIPNKARELLKQAVASMHAPAGAVMLAASSVDAMLKEKGYRDGSLYARIERAAADHIITTDMAAWAHDIRLDANDQRHADDSAKLPTEADAMRCTEFAAALGQFMFVLPARISRGRQAAASNS
jgi:Domain of unknown function (DUF4145)